jgi:phage anti-repressor protein
MAKSKAQQALDFVRREAKRADSATDLHNAFFGNGGQFQRLFPTRAQREAFARTPEYQEIVQIRESLERNAKPAS